MTLSIREYVPLAPLTTFHTGGNARYFFEVTTKAELPHLFLFAKEHDIPVLVLGGGSNVLIDDRGYHGLVISMHIEGVVFMEHDDIFFLTAGAGVHWDALVEEAVMRGGVGAENLSLIPGTVGGAVVQNIGAYGCEVSSIIESVEVYDAAQNEFRILTNTECRFGYRESTFKHEGKEFVIVSVQFRLRANGAPNILYKDVAKYFENTSIASPKSIDVRRAIIDIRTGKFPQPRTHGTAGSFFKNPVVSVPVAEKILQRFPNAVHYDIGSGMTKFSAAWIIDNVLHMRGVRVGDVGCWEAQALVVVNYGSATSAQIKNFAHMIQEKFFHAMNISLECEVIFIDA